MGRMQRTYQQSSSRSSSCRVRIREQSHAWTKGGATAAPGPRAEPRQRAGHIYVLWVVWLGWGGRRLERRGGQEDCLDLKSTLVVLLSSCALCRCERVGLFVSGVVEGTGSKAKGKASIIIIIVICIAREFESSVVPHFFLLTQHNTKPSSSFSRTDNTQAWCHLDLPGTKCLHPWFLTRPPRTALPQP